MQFRTKPTTQELAACTALLGPRLCDGLTATDLVRALETYTQGTSVPDSTGMRMLTAQQVAARLGVCVRTVYNMSREGVIRGVLMRKRGIRFPEVDLDSLADRRTVAPSAAYIPGANRGADGHAA